MKAGLQSKEILVKANKIINLWVEQQLPYTRVHLLEEKYKDHAAKCKEKEERDISLARFQNLSISGFDDEKERSFYDKSTNQLGQKNIQYKHQKMGSVQSMNLWEY